MIVKGTLALIGGAEWRSGCTFDRELLELSKSKEVLVIPTAAAYEFPDKAVEWARTYFATLGAKVAGLNLLGRPDAFKGEIIEKVMNAKFIYIGGGSPLHLRSVLKNTPTYSALVKRFCEGAVLAASSAGAMVLTDPMSDPRGGALTVGLGLLSNIAFVPHFDTYPRERETRTISLATGGVVVAGVSERTALIRSPEGTWSSQGQGSVKIYADGGMLSLDQLEERVQISSCEG